ncbi:MAG: undecaprenyl/decaprenyl-phosphate alpha-N-acetylglucosaminyl 1-phosphate transferase [Clostridiales bacterium]|nr:undecaprenyl/decaprenyl-phosphate alpha-N-acetylglucosaminyl 1-phosphate transferase [Clostridiales bacterium]
MNYIEIIEVLVVAFIASFLFTPAIRKLAIKLNAIDVPTEKRRVHTKPIPRLGGLAIVLGFIISLLAHFILEISSGDIVEYDLIFKNQLMGLMLGILIIEIAGIWDDIKPIKAWTKLLFQIAAATVVVGFGVRIDFITNPFNGAMIYFPNYIAIPLTMIWIVGITNAINFIDGLDGLAAGTASISSLSLLFISIFWSDYELIFLTAALAGATLGFLPFNFNPAKIFMGEAGSAFLGFTLGTISIMGMIKSYATLAIVIPLVVLGLPIFDTAFAIIRRLLKGQSPMKADRGHLHHRLVDSGLTQKQAVLILYAISAVLGLAGLLIVQGMWKIIILFVIIMIFIVAGRKFVLDMSNTKEEEK